MGDFKAKVWKSNLGNNNSVMGRFEFGQRNQRRDRLVDFAV